MAVTGRRRSEDGRLYCAERAVVPGYRESNTEVETPGRAYRLVANE